MRDKVCARPGCGIVIEGSPSYVKKRKYCSHECNALVNFGFKTGAAISAADAEVCRKFEELESAVEKAEGFYANPDKIGKLKELVIHAEKFGVPEIDPELIKVRRTIKMLGKCIKYGAGDEPLGEIDWDGNFTSY